MTRHWTMFFDREFEVRDGLVRRGTYGPDLVMTTLIDLHRVARLRKGLRRIGLPAPSYLAVTAKAVAMALKEQPAMNRISVVRPFWRRVTQLSREDISIVPDVSAPGGFRPERRALLLDAYNKNVTSIDHLIREASDGEPEVLHPMGAMRRILDRIPRPVAAWWLSLHQACPRVWLRRKGSAVSLSRSSRGGPEILCSGERWPVQIHLGPVRQRPVVCRKRVVPHPTAYLTHSFDSRLTTPDAAARFNRRLAEILERAEIPIPSCASSLEERAVAGACSLAPLRRASIGHVLQRDHAVGVVVQLNAGNARVTGVGDK